MVPRTADCGLTAFRRLVWLSLALLVACTPPFAVGGGNTTGPVLRVMSYNIQAGGGNLEGVAATIRDAAPDIVGLQEVDVHWGERSSFADQAAVLARSLGMQARFARIYRIVGADSTERPREYGVALLTRCPILSFTNHPLTRLSTQAVNPVPSPMPGFLEAVVDLGGTTVRVFNTHLDYRADPSVRQQQVAEMLAVIGASSGPTLLFGDLNARPQAPELQPLFGKLSDAWARQTDPGLTYPATQPDRRIDYILTSTHFSVRSVRVPVTRASDHRPVVAELVLARKAGDRRTSCDGNG
jgi:endonuclease/exonuclease/phosphatase family metal-dependent hydrolase